MKQSKADKQLDKDIEQALSQLAKEFRVSNTDIVNIFREVKVAVTEGRTLEGVMKEIVARYQRLAELQAVYASLHAQAPQVEEKWVWVYGPEVATIAEA